MRCLAYSTLMPGENLPRPTSARDIAPVLGVAAGTLALHLLTGGRYGFHRDELATYVDAQNLAWGYVWQAPITPLFGRLSLVLFGTSLLGFRFFASLPVTVALVLTGLMTRQLEGGRGAQLMAMVAAVPFALVAGARLQYTAFDFMFWTLTAYCVLRLLKSDDPRWWIAVGAALGLGIMAKYTIIMYAAGLAMGVVATDARRYLRSKWLWYSMAVSLVIVLPNLIWQVKHNFITLDFIRSIHARDIRYGRTAGFISDQFNLTLFAIPIWMAGLYFYGSSPQGRRFRVMGWMYVVPLLLFLISKGRGYYLAPAYPMLYAAGAVEIARWLATERRGWRYAVPVLLWTLLAADAAMAVAFMLPVAPADSAWGRMAITRNGDFQEEIGWPELVATIANIRDSLPAAYRPRLGILAGNYGEAGAIDLYGGSYGLPKAISGMNSFWLHGYGNPPPEILIVVGVPRELANRHLRPCSPIGHTGNQYGIANEETRMHPDIFVCGGPIEGWPKFWDNFRYFG